MPPAIAPNAHVLDDLAAFSEDDLLQKVLKQGNALGLQVVLNGIEVMTIPPQLGAEPLKKEHLLQVLKELAAKQFIPALTLQLIQAADMSQILGTETAPTSTIRPKSRTYSPHLQQEINHAN